MWLDLKDVIEMPGAEASFECELDASALDFPSVRSFIVPPRAEGRAVNTAGVLSLQGVLEAEMQCVCDRCGGIFNMKKTMELDVPLEADMEDEDDPDIFPIENNGIDLDEVLSTCFILDMDTKFLCSPDCKGLCGTCGKNLNEGSCSCTKQTDPRLAVLGQLLDIDDK